MHKDEEDRIIRAATPMERHVQSILLGIALMLLGWVGKAVVDSGEHLARIDERVATLQTQVSETYRKSDATRDVSDARLQIDELRRRVSAVEDALNGRKHAGAP